MIDERDLHWNGRMGRMPLVTIFGLEIKCLGECLVGIRYLRNLIFLPFIINHLF